MEENCAVELQYLENIWEFCYFNSKENLLFYAGIIKHRTKVNTRIPEELFLLSVQEHNGNTGVIFLGADGGSPDTVIFPHKADLI